MLASVVAVSFLATSCGTFVPLPGASCPLTPANSFWRAKVTSLPAHASNTAWKGTIGTAKKLKADFGSGLWEGEKIGIPYNVVSASTPRRTVTFDIDDQSDHVGYPIPNPPKIEGGGDRHVLMFDKDSCRLWETWATYPGAGNSWTTGVQAGSGATWDMTSNAMRPNTWTSADAAGLPILPGLVRYEEVAAGKVYHAIRVTVPVTQKAFVWPASHQAGSTSSVSAPPMGAWMRLSPSINPNSFPASVRPIIVALQTYGAVIADNGSALYMSGAPDERWNNDDLQTLGGITVNDFTFVDTSSLKVANNSYQATTAS